MHELLHRSAIALLLVSGAVTACVAADIWLPADLAAAGLVAHRQFLLALLGTGLVIAAFMPSLRLPAVAAAITSKAAFLFIWMGAPQAVPGHGAALEGGLLVLLLFAGTVFAREAWQDARWHGMLPLRDGY